MNFNLFKGLKGNGKARTSAPAPRRTQLQVETLENRLVPTAYIQNLQFPLYDAMHNQMGTLGITQQTGNTFAGTLHDNGWNINIPISGQLVPYNNGWDGMTFNGGSGNGFVTENVSFNGLVYEGAPHVMEGYLNESGSYWTFSLSGFKQVSFSNTYGEYSQPYGLLY
jgi:hypothetical protein